MERRRAQKVPSFARRTAQRGTEDVDLESGRPPPPPRRSAAMIGIAKNGQPMTRDELIDNYLLGTIGPRAFVLGLVAEGVPMRAAAMHAVALKMGTWAPRANANNADDNPDDSSMTSRSHSLARRARRE
jgi:hypothetical protein